MFFCCQALQSAVQAATFEFDASGNPLRWDLVNPDSHTGLVGTNVVNPKTRAVRFFLANDGWSKTNTAAELNGLRAAFAVWQSTPDSVLKFEEGGLVLAGVDVDELDKTNVVFWAKKSTWVAGGTVNIVGSTAVTFRAYAGSLMVGADIVLNGVNYFWFTDFETVPSDSRYYFVESIITHEIGHFIGLGHSPLGGSTMFYRDPGGIGPYTSLSNDDRLGVQYLYPKTGLLNTRGIIRGTITVGGTNVLGAVVIAEDAAGNIAAASVSRPDGTYYLPCLPPGTYSVRVSPLAPSSASPFLVRGSEIGAAYASAMTSFLPTGGTNVIVTANQTRTLDFKLTGLNPALRIVGIRPASRDLSHAYPVNVATRMRVGESNCFVGVYSRESLTDATLSVTGGGVSVENVTATSAWGYNLLFATVSVSSNAIPGLRSLIVRRGSDVAHANGFFEVAAAWPDDNYDGLDDLFQRRYFPLWVAAEAGPNADPDNDGFTNRYEYMAGSSPADDSSLPVVELDDVTLDSAGITLGWTGVAGARYQVWRRDSFATTDSWRKVGTAVTASAGRVEFLDSTARERVRFYKVEVLPGF